MSLVVFRRDAQGNVTGFEAGNGRLIRLRMRPLQIRNFSLRRPSVADLLWLHARLDRTRYGRTRLGRPAMPTRTGPAPSPSTSSAKTASIARSIGISASESFSSSA